MLTRNAVAGNDGTRQRNNGVDLLIRTRQITMLVAGIADFNPDRARIDITDAFPGPGTRVPGAG